MTRHVALSHPITWAGSHHQLIHVGSRSKCHLYSGQTKLADRIPNAIRRKSPRRPDTHLFTNRPIKIRQSTSNSFFRWSRSRPLPRHRITSFLDSRKAKSLQKLNLRILSARGLRSALVRIATKGFLLAFNIRLDPLRPLISGRI